MFRDRLKVLYREVMKRIPAHLLEGKSWFAFVLTCSLICNMLLYALINPYEHGAVYPLVYVTALLVLIRLAATQRITVHQGIHWGTFFGLLHMLYGVYHTGGIFSPQLAWTLVVPLTPYFVIGRSAGLIWLLVTLLVQACVGLLTYQKWIFQPTELTQSNANTSALAYLTLTVFLIVIPVLYVRMGQGALQKTQAQNASLEQKRQALELIAQQREQFISSISHELRTPMNAIMGFTGLLSQRFESQPSIHQILEHSKHSAEHLMTVINDILDHSQMHSGRLSAHYEVFSLRQVVQYAFNLFALKAKENDLNYILDMEDNVPEWVETNPHRLTQVLLNLLGNAIKFTAKGHVHLRVENVPSGILFSVSDTGIGIAPESRAHIFQRYSQATESIQQRYGGNGLGLSISRKLVEWLGGHMDFESHLHQGSTFWFLLPLKAMNPHLKQRECATPGVTSPEERWRFLVVDDHKINRLLVRQVLCQAWPNCEVFEVEDGLQAIEWLQSSMADVVFMDMVMPVMDGVEATRKIRAQRCGGDLVHIVGLTANVNPSDLEAFKAAGLDDLLLKPFRADALMVILQRLLWTHVPSKGFNEAGVQK
jgi:signal transduction histidine kinase/CheY-like chemotaxis protein